MKTADIKEHAPGIDESLIREHLQSLESRYAERFSAREIAYHLRELPELSSTDPIRARLLRNPDGAVECTILGFDHAFVLSFITGVLASADFEIVSGDIFTTSRAEAADNPRGADERPAHRRPAARRSAPRRPTRRFIIDRFVGQCPPEGFDGRAAQVENRLRRVFLLLEQNQPDSLTQAKRQVNELVAARLASRQLDSLAVLYPMHIEVENSGDRCTRMKVLTENTPFFLFSFSTALSLRNVSIEHVAIRTRDNRVEDEFEFVDAVQGGKLPAARLDEVKLSLLLTKQFTYFLGKAADPFASLARFEDLIAEVLKLPEQGRLFDLLSNPKIMEDLARILGTSDFLWEDFIRLQYENLIPMLGPYVERRLSDPATLESRLQATMKGAVTLEDKVERLNAFKDRESYLVDLDHILDPDTDFRALSERLTALAELVVNTAFQLAYQALVQRYGPPQTVAGLEAHYAVLGLGKLGGQALGYASDIEILCVYGDSGETAGSRTDPSGGIGNAEFFERLVRDAAAMIKTKREGIFRVDLRLRPYGKDGPLACSLDSFCRYYGKGGAAHSFEKLALVRLRAFGGDPSLGAMVERLRDRMIYSSRSIDLSRLKQLREKQLAEKTGSRRLNAKYSPGALVDLEYAVQILQIMHGQSTPALRTPSIHRALDGLLQAGVIEKEEAERLVFAYRFLRRLINALRMLRGSARDLFLPPEGSMEFVHAARRMDYVPRGEISPETALHLDFQTASAFVRVFIEQHFGRGSWPDPSTGNVADLVLNEDMAAPLTRRILRRAGIGDSERAATNLRSLAGRGRRREAFARLAVLAFDILERKPDPDMALNNWERLVRAIPDGTRHFEDLLAQPMRLEILLSIFSVSQFLSDTLIAHPSFFDWVTRPENVHRIRAEEEMEKDLSLQAHSSTSRDQWLQNMRLFRKREILRIGTRDICLHKPIEEIVDELANLAEAIICVCLERIWADMIEDGLLPYERSFCVLAFGKLGGRELNYSSDVDLLGVFVEPLAGADGQVLQLSEAYAQLMERLRSDLSTITREGYAYRVDLRLRPYGRSGPLVPTEASLERYYRSEAELWEIQALLKARPVAGNRELGRGLLQRLQPLLAAPRDAHLIWRSVAELRAKAVRKSSDALLGSINVKEQTGGIRDIEFLVQALQLIHAHAQASLLCGGTLTAIRRLERHDILDRLTARVLTDDYLFLRRVEHHLQILEDQQVHILPNDDAELNALAKRLLGVDSSAEAFVERLRGTMNRVSGIVRRFGAAASE